VDRITQFCFATEIRESAKLILGNNVGLDGWKKKGLVLTNREDSSLVIDSLCDRAGGRNAAVACFYFDFAAQKEQSSTGMLGAVLKQVVGGLDEVPGEIAQAYGDQKKVIGGRGPRLSDLVKMLQTTSSEKRTFVCIDALDECVAEHQVKLLSSLNQILRKSPGTRIFVTGRPHIQAEIGKRLNGRVTSVSITPRRDDIISYLHSRLDEDITPDAMDSSLEAEILKKIPDDISEMYVLAPILGKLSQLSTNRYTSRFLLVSLSTDAILQETTIHRRRQKLSAMTTGLGLGDAYGATLDRIKGQGGEKARLGMAVLMWISHSERPLKSDELCHALAVEIGSPDVNTDNVPSIGTLLSCCQGLIAVDKKASIVRLIHSTLQEYLRVHPKLFGAAHSTMAETCLSYLNSQQVKALSTRSSPDLRGTPFLEYSSVYWGVHAEQDLSDCAKLLALKLFGDHNNHMPTQILLRAQKRYPYVVDYGKLSLFSGIHWAAMFGIVEIVASLVQVEGCDINQRDCTGNTPLAWAAYYGHEGVVEILLGRSDIHPDKLDNHGRTPLRCAAWSGHEGVVQMLLGRGDVNPNKPGWRDRAPLWCAAQSGHEGVVKILLGRGDVSPDKPDSDGVTPLCCAAWHGHEGVIKILLGRDDVDPGRPDNHGRTPLRCAAWNGHEGVVKVLLGWGGINPDKPDNDGLTALWCAAGNGHEGVVKILLGRDDVTPDRPDNHGRTPLRCAAWNGHEGVVRILLGRNDVNPNKPDNRGRTPLWCAAKRGHAGVVALLQPPESATHSTSKAE